MKKAVITIASILVAIAIFFAAYSILMPLYCDIEIIVLKPSSSSEKHFEPVMLAYTHMPQAYMENVDYFSDSCSQVHKDFIEQHKDDNYDVHTDVTIENGQTIVHFHGTITDAETGEESIFDKRLVFDFVFTKQIS